MDVLLGALFVIIVVVGGGGLLISMIQGILGTSKTNEELSRLNRTIDSLQTNNYDYTPDPKDDFEDWEWAEYSKLLSKFRERKPKWNDVDGYEDSEGIAYYETLYEHYQELLERNNEEVSA